MLQYAPVVRSASVCVLGFLLCCWLLSPNQVQYIYPAPALHLLCRLAEVITRSSDWSHFISIYMTLFLLIHIFYSFPGHHCHILLTSSLPAISCLPSPLANTHTWASCPSRHSGHKWNSINPRAGLSGCFFCILDHVLYKCNNFIVVEISICYNLMPTTFFKKFWTGSCLSICCSSACNFTVRLWTEESNCCNFESEMFFYSCLMLDSCGSKVQSLLRGALCFIMCPSFLMGRKQVDTAGRASLGNRTPFTMESCCCIMCRFCFFLPPGISKAFLYRDGCCLLNYALITHLALTIFGPQRRFWIWLLSSFLFEC